MSGRSRKRGELLERLPAPPRRRLPPQADDGESYQYKRVKVEAYYDEEQDYHFAQALEESEDWYKPITDEHDDTIDKMASSLDDVQRRAVRWRIRTLRGIAVANTLVLLGAVLPIWIVLMVNCRQSLNAQNVFRPSCDDGKYDRITQCVYYNHELATYSAFSGLWLFGTLFQSLFMCWTSWRLHNKSFQGILSVWCMAFIIVDIVVIMFSITISMQMAEDFNWLIASATNAHARAPSYAPIVKHLKNDLKGIVSFSILLLATQISWLVVMRQVLQFGLNLKEFGGVLCGDDPSTSSTRDESDFALLPEHNEEDEIELEAQGGYNDDPADQYEHGSGSSSVASNSPLGNSSEAANNPINDVLSMMTALTSTMTALNNKIDAIESRVGDGSALLVMPPGENQWDARKPERL